VREEESAEFNLYKWEGGEIIKLREEGGGQEVQQLHANSVDAHIQFNLIYF